MQISQEAGQVVWPIRILILYKNFPQFFVIHTVKGFGIVNKAEVAFFPGILAVLMIQWMLVICSLVPLLFLNPDWTSGSSWFMYCSVGTKSQQHSYYSSLTHACILISPKWAYLLKPLNCAHVKGITFKVILTSCTLDFWQESAHFTIIKDSCGNGYLILALSVIAHWRVWFMSWVFIVQTGS